MMDLRQVLNLYVICSDRWLQASPCSWDFGNDHPNVKVEIGDIIRPAEHVYDFAIRAKLDGNYDVSIHVLTKLINTCWMKSRSIFVPYAVALFESLMCANAYSYAFDWIATMCADVQNDPYVSTKDKSYLFSLFKTLKTLAVCAIDLNDYYGVQICGKMFSRSSDYRPQMDPYEIKNELQQVRNMMRKHGD